MKTALLVFLVLVGFAFSKEQRVDSKVVQVTVFKDRALVTREARIDLPKGQHTLIFSDITTNIRDESVRINVPDLKAKILDVKIERRFTTESRKENIKNLQKKIEKLKLQDKIASDQISVLDSKKEFVESLKAESARYYNQNILLNTASQKQWTASLEFVGRNLTKIYSDIRELISKREKLDKEIHALKFEIEQISQNKIQNYKEIIVKLETITSGTIELQPTYIVNDAGWYPIYDIRVVTKDKQAELSYYGMVHQTTSEDWDGIKLILSTADPLSVTTLPQLEKWFLDTRPQPPKRKQQAPRSKSTSDYSIEYDQNMGLADGKGSVSGYVVDKETGEPLPGANLYFDGTSVGAAADINGKFNIPNVDKGRKTLVVKYIGYQDLKIKIDVREKYNADLMIRLEFESIEGEEIMVTAQAEKPMQAINQQLASNAITNRKGHLLFSNANNKVLSTVFELKTKNSIPSDNNPHKITVFKDNMNVDFNYVSVPKLNSDVYLRGKIINSTKYPLLAGELNVFMDNDFVNRTYLNTIVPSDTLELALGTDDNIQIEKVLNKRFVETKGLLGGDTRVTYDFDIRLKNNRNTEETIEIKDQIPVAANENIKIELIQPSKEEKTVTKDGEIVWNVKIKAGEKKVIPFKYFVEFPSDIFVYGLE